MIGFLQGTLVDVMADTVLLDVHGIGFEVMVHTRGLRAMPGKNQALKIYTWLQVNDNELRLYGFLSRQEIDLFKRLIAISGIGPKVAMAILGHFEPGDFYRAVASQDLKTLTAVPGVGKKSAERLMFELKDRIPLASFDSGPEGGEVGTLLDALMALGYSREEVYPQVMNLVEKGKLGTLEENLRQILKAKGGRFAGK
ncbi:MAG: Holliday junction branch migration protein RuvA [Syntrophomonadales bacterium]|jgi:Holliday junction DNA helicase RuvA